METIWNHIIYTCSIYGNIFLFHPWNGQEIWTCIHLYIHIWIGNLKHKWRSLKIDVVYFCWKQWLWPANRSPCYRDSLTHLAWDFAVGHRRMKANCFCFHSEKNLSKLILWESIIPTFRASHSLVVELVEPPKKRDSATYKLIKQWKKYGKTYESNWRHMKASIDLEPPACFWYLWILTATTFPFM